jgi:curved DNA-binding protein CbpA
MKCLYETLEISPCASGGVIRAAYRCLAQAHHPDRSGVSPDLGQRMTDINHAYAVLSDFEKRRKYDHCRGLSAVFNERRGLDAKSPIRQRAQEQASTRPFAFRPLI